MAGNSTRIGSVAPGRGVILHSRGWIEVGLPLARKLADTYTCGVP